MTAEFSSNGFSAVASFFGKTDEDVKKDARSEKHGSPKHKDVKMFNKRLGVGANNKRTEEGKKNQDMLSSEAKKKIMSIGRKNKRKLDDDDGDDDGEVDDEGITKDNSSNYHDSDDDDEEEGRTSAVKAKVINKSQDNIIPHQGVVGKKKKKKKQSKKERQREIEKAANKTNDGDDNIKQQYEKSMIEGKIKDLNTDGSTKNDATKPINKRRKIRSKQKNVRKDNRSSSQKPDYLQIGSVSYQGRPLTTETRTFMNLPPESRTSRIKKERMNFKKLNEASTGPNSNDSNQSDMKLGIDDFMDSPTETVITAGNTTQTTKDNIELKKDNYVPNNNMDDSGELIMNIDKTQQKHGEEPKYKNKNDTKQKKKKKKSKYKNLR